MIRPMTRSTLILTFAALSTAVLIGQQAAERSFATPQEAAQALVDAAGKNDTAALLKLFGPQSADIVQSGDPAEDKDRRAEFARRAHEKMTVQVEPANPNRAVIIAGNDDWPLPIPLVRTKAGQWHFDIARGRVEILARRVGRNELVAIDVCRGYVEAQMEYASRDRNGNGVLDYAQRIVSTPGKKNGLYSDGDPDSLVPKAFGQAAAAIGGGKTAEPYHGYYFRILTSQGPDAPGGAQPYVVKGDMIGGFALIAYPAKYGDSGIKTFIVNHRGIVYEKDLGPATDTLAPRIARFNPDKTWQPVQGE
ncbi:MAG: DUF2950 domain-containing protein [Acidobacteriia bacterium]|nr:DUF2950 domain-containing protein [Terriglobia bacterium]